MTGKVLQNKDANSLLDFKIQTCKHLAHYIPNITVVERTLVWLTDMAIPGDSGIENKEFEKIAKYQDLRIEVQRLLEKKADVVPVMIGALITILKDPEKHLRTLALTKQHQVKSKKLHY